MKQLLLSVHDVTPHHFERLKAIHAFLQDLGVGPRYAMLIVPDFWQQWPLEEHPDFANWIRDRAKEGVEMILHGFTHRDESSHASAFKSWKARTLTAREGEFYGLSRDQAEERLQNGIEVLRQACGLEVQGFVAPAWLYSDGARDALGALGFRFAEDHWHVWSPARQATLCRGPVISYASRSEGRIRSSLFWSRLADWLLRPLPVMRLAIHPHDLDSQRLVEEIRRTISRQQQRRTLCQYAELAA
ncbi:MAG: polysaccharide deacetylase family protein [Robiginitomaculum sp.]|nr:polysaccharide deacetylase family protein [Robiginitomaculum sp.]MDQ7076753.1 polysaccharide deacetylase family protein [Robiginitomaculum sp.]